MGLIRQLGERLIEIPGVVAVTLGGSRAGADSDWGFRLYYSQQRPGRPAATSEE